MHRLRLQSLSCTALLAATSFLSACGGASQANAPTRSPHFDEVSSHLHLGGEVYLYADVDGDLSALTKEVTGLLLEVDPSGDLNPTQIEKVLHATGLANVQAFGLSSYEDGKLFHNRAYLKLDGQREGMLKVMGGQPHAFETLALAPAGSDLVLEQDLHLKQGYAVLMDVLRAFEPQMVKEIEQELVQPLPGLAVTGNDLVKAADTKLMVVVKLDPERRIELQELSPPISLPHVDFAIALDGYGFLVDQAADQYGQAGLFDVSRDGDTLFLQLNIPAPPELQGYKPVLARRGTRVWLASTRAFLDATLAPGAKLASDPAWAKASKGLATEGNGLSYLSPEFFSVVRTLTQQVPAGEDERAIMHALVNFFVPDGEDAIAGVQVNGTDSLYYASTSTFSHKVTLGMFVYLNPVTLGVLGAIAIPSFMNYTEASALAAEAMPAPIAPPPPPAPAPPAPTKPAKPPAP